ncbi:MAG: ABC transporter ATP-binding protein [Bradymonadaceae bacterium]
MVKKILTTFEMQYRKGPTIAADIELDVERDRIWVLFGHSGSGKTTFLRVLAGLERPGTGVVRVDEDVWLDTNRRVFLPPAKRHVGFLHQEYALFPHMSVDDNILYGLKARRVRDGDKRLAEVKAMLRIESLGPRRPGRLSGGQRQRVAIARALVTRPRIVLADEPTANLDSVTGRTIIELMKELNENEQTTFIFSTHDHRIMEHAKRIIHLEDGRVIDDGLGTSPRAQVMGQA